MRPIVEKPPQRQVGGVGQGMEQGPRLARQAQCQGWVVADRFAIVKAGRGSPSRACRPGGLSVRRSGPSSCAHAPAWAGDWPKRKSFVQSLTQHNGAYGTAPNTGVISGESSAKAKPVTVQGDHVGFRGPKFHWPSGRIPASVSAASSRGSRSRTASVFG